MDNAYKAPESSLESEKQIDPHILIRPLSVTIIAYIFIVLGAIDLLFTIKKGFIYATGGEDAFGNNVSGFRVEVLWLILYGIGAGLMRRGKFARAMACFIGLIMFIAPGLIFIYLFYFSQAKEYFNDKSCPGCNTQKWLNKGIGYKKQHCRQCGWEVSIKNDSD